MDVKSSYKSGFPSWVSTLDHKLLQTISPTAVKADLVVAQDGSGDFGTIKDAVDAAAVASNGGRFVIYVKEGVYVENVKIESKLENIMLVGDGKGRTIVTGDRNRNEGYQNDLETATFAAKGKGFIARDITFRNTAGPENGQAIALYSSSDHSAFHRCGFEGYQDTLYVHSNLQFYRECDIYGTIDFIFGDAAVVIQNCKIVVRKPLPNQKNTITAQGRKTPDGKTGISIQNCIITATPDLNPNQNQTFLGRPWQQFSRTVFLENYMDSFIDPAGWLEWNDNTSDINTLFYAEYKNTGPGSNTSKRVKWGGYHVINDLVTASEFTVGNFIEGGTWLPSTGIPFNLDLN